MFAANPTKNFTIAFSMADIRKAIHKIVEQEPSKYSLVNDDQVLNQVRLHEKITAWDVGYHIDFILKKNTDTETQVKVEVSRKIGVINDKSEVHNANYIIKEITDKFSAYLSGNIDTNTGTAKIPQNKGCLVFLMIAIITSLLILL